MSEFSRLPADLTAISQLISEDLQLVADALHNSLINSMMVEGKGSVTQFIAAQFKNMNMKQSQLEPKVIDKLHQYPQLKAIKCTFSYNDNESMITTKGVRTFRIQRRE
ncbi:unnamed protein product [Adineta steineri]|uniref:Uncharacterized protein n=1 Tax=Adineta steineri TaxID=433720 RepID=A0A813XUN3_9BILA|nr:unnamed protein product [Adineta steineri]CAF1343293.1 unnamed protein product [Adineta steineri]CAF4124949.1 unnamed protein product [Adineta steineri]CAF4142982.1 unnamed protein product [Adineta steineri]